MSRLLLALFACLAGCAAGHERGVGPKRPLWLIANGFHTALIFRAQDAPEGWQKLHDGPRADYLLVGWGNHSFYMGGRRNVLTITRAAFLPDVSVLHFVPIRGSIAHTFSRSDLVRFELTPAAHAAVCNYIERELARDAAGATIPVQSGPLIGSRFNRGRSPFIFPHLCTVWTARGLQAGGVRMLLPAAFTADNVVSQARRSGTLMQRKRRPADLF